MQSFEPTAKHYIMSAENYMHIDDHHKIRIKKELRAAGVTKYGLRKFATAYLPKIIKSDEHVKGAVYGRYREDSGLLAFSEAMLVATDQRVMFLDHKPGHTNIDEISYHAVSGVQRSSGGLFSAVTLHTKVKNYTLRYANNQCVEIFMRYIESQIMEKPSKTPEELEVKSDTHQLDSNTIRFLRTHDLGVLSTATDSRPRGATVHYLIDELNKIYILSKSSSQKARNITRNKQVALTIYDTMTLQTVQLEGEAAVETDPDLRQRVWGGIVRQRDYGDSKDYPPVTKQPSEAYTVLRITPATAKFSDFHK